MILDTSFLIDVMNSDADALEKVDELEANGHTQKIPAMTLQELFIGVGASNLPKSERQKIETIVESRPVLETTETIARQAGLIDGELRRDGSRIDIGDATIGATAFREDEPVVPGNSEHVKRIDGIDVESY